MKSCTISSIVLLAAVAALGRPASAQETMSQPVFSSGAVTSANEQVRIAGTVGQQVIGAASGTNGLTQVGFWYGVSLPGPEVRTALDSTRTPTYSEEVAVVVESPDNFQPTERLLYYRKAGRHAFNPPIPLNDAGGELRGVIPADSVSLRGIEYYVTLRKGRRTSKTDPTHVTVAVPRYPKEGMPVPVELRTNAERYRMVSIPLALSDTEVETVFENDFGTFNQYVWRLLRHKGGDCESGIECYEEYGIDLTSTLTAGTAFWLISGDDGQFDITAEAGATSSDASAPYRLRIEEGYNQIGNPFAFPVAWNEVAVAAEGVDKDDIKGPWAFDESVQDYHGAMAAILQPWTGYFIYNDAGREVDLLIPTREAPSSMQLAAQEVPFTTGSVYALQLVADLMDYGMRDTQNYIGFAHENPDAPTELLEPPGIGNRVRLSILSERKHLAASFRPGNDEGQQWNLEISAALDEEMEKRGTRITVSMLEHGPRPEGFEIYVLDRDLGAPVAVSQQAFSVELSKERPVRRLHVIVGTEAYADAHREGVPLAPVAFMLEQNYPNPFNPETVIAYQVSQRGPVAVEVFSALGQHVCTLVRAQQEAGRYEIRWDGRSAAGQPVASGVYFYKLQSGGNTAVKKMLLLR